MPAWTEVTKTNANGTVYKERKTFSELFGIKETREQEEIARFAHFVPGEHFELAAKIKPLYESAILITSHGNLKNPEDPNVVSIKRFVAAAILQSGKKADVLITVKESIANGHKIYSIELDEINKASERFQGLSDAAETANRATKTPHVDN